MQIKRLEQNKRTKQFTNNYNFFQSFIGHNEIIFSFNTTNFNYNINTDLKQIIFYKLSKNLIASKTISKAYEVQIIESDVSEIG